MSSTTEPESKRDLSSTFRRLPTLPRSPFRTHKPSESTPPSQSALRTEVSPKPPSRTSSLAPTPVAPPESRLPTPPEVRAGELDEAALMAKLNVNERRPLENVQSERNAEPVSSTEEPKASSSSKPKARTRSFSKETTKKPVASAKPRPVQTRVQPSLAGSTTVTKAPAAAMYFSPCPAHGFPPERPLRAHTGVLVGQKIYVIGGCDSRGCWRDMASFDTETFMWNPIDTHGEELPPLRAHTATLVGDLIYVFGGGDGPSYSNEVWVFDTILNRWSRPNIATPKASHPLQRRAHTTCLYRNFLVVFGGGNGQAALNDVWALDVSDPNRLTWHEWRTRGDVPPRKGYHSASLVGDRMVVFGGSDGHASFADVHVLNLQTLTWTLVYTEVKHSRLSHTATQVGSYLFIIGGHNGQSYAQEVLLFNLVTLAWETKQVYGVPPPGRGYHVSILHDSRIFISGGYNGSTVYSDLWVLDLAASAYLPQVTTFEIDETAEHLREAAAAAGVV